MDEVTVATYLYRDQAEISRAYLESLGLRVRVAVDDEGGLNPGFFANYAIRLVVPAAEAEQAREALGEVS